MRTNPKRSARARLASEELWPSTGSDRRPFREVAFEPSDPEEIVFIPENLEGAVDQARIHSKRDPFPYPVAYQHPAWGLVSRLPPDVEQAPEYVWALSSDGSFVHRAKLWEDDARSLIRNGICLPTIAEDLIELTAFLRNLAERNAWNSRLSFDIRVRLEHVRGRYLARHPDPARYMRRSGEPSPASSEVIEVVTSTTLEGLQRGDRAAAELILDVTEHFGWTWRTDGSNQVSVVLSDARKAVGI